MRLEDRVVTTDALRRLNGPDGGGWVQLGPGVLDRTDPLGLHVLVPAGTVADADIDLLCCHALLQVGAASPLAVRVLIPREHFLALPTAFEALYRVGQLMTAAALTGVDEWLGTRIPVDADDQ